MNKSQVLVLAGGVGKRFWPLQTPKPLFTFQGKSLLQHNLDNLRQAGFTNVIVVTSPSIKLPEITTVVQSDAQGMAAAVLAAAPKLTSDPLLIIGATDIVDSSLYATLKQHIGTNFLVAKKTHHYFPGGYIKLEGNVPTSVVEKPGEGNEPSDLLKLVFDGFAHPKAFIDLLRQTQSSTDDIYEQALSQLLTREKFSVISYDNYWQATKYPWHLLDAMNYFLDQIDSQDQIIIESGVKIFANAIIKGPAYIGKNTIIGNGALVRNSMIGANCVVGYNTEIARSYIGDNCWFHSNYIGDSVLEHNVSFGAGSILANLRLDEGEVQSTGRRKLGAIIGSDVRVGVNTSIMPGIKIGHNTQIGAGLTISQDIPDDSFVKAEIKLHISPNKVKLDPTSREKFKSNL